MSTFVTVETGETLATVLCIDCGALHANHDTSNNPRCGTQEGQNDWIAQVVTHLDGCNVTVDEGTRDWYEFLTGCGSCGSTIAGSGYNATLWPTRSYLR